jgi:hypothetical protein
MPIIRSNLVVNRRIHIYIVLATAVVSCMQLRSLIESFRRRPRRTTGAKKHTTSPILTLSHAIVEHSPAVAFTAHGKPPQGFHQPSSWRSPKRTTRKHTHTAAATASSEHSPAVAFTAHGTGDTHSSSFPTNHSSHSPTQHEQQTPPPTPPPPALSQPHPPPPPPRSTLSPPPSLLPSCPPEPPLLDGFGKFLKDLRGDWEPHARVRDRLAVLQIRRTLLDEETVHEKIPAV